MNTSPPRHRPLRTAALAAVAATGLVASLIGVVATSTVSSAAADCTRDARYVDPAGDVNDLALDPVPLPGVPVDPALDPDGLDIREGWFTVNDTLDTITFHLKVTDLSDLQGGLRGVGEEYQIDFALGGTSYSVLAGRSLTDLLFTEEYFELSDLGGADGARRTVNSALTGAFDPALDVITVDLRKSDLSGASPAVPEFTDASVITDVEVVTRRNLLLLSPDADVAVGGCAFKVVPDPDPTTPPVTVTATATATTTATATATTTTTATATATATRTEEITQTAEPNRKPVIRKFAAKPLQGQGKARVGTPIRFKAIAKDPDGDTLRYRWDLGDGTKKSGRKVFHTYREEGQYRVLVRIRDGRGGNLKVRAFLRLGPRKTS
ncbi:PKD domain-containing protein [uncultured Nocardioides sp.]|uniref:PKD domain-containing protein n=1 Tax=uncultured Nocardioides sp. TaxID=198441 RepID=UPI000C545C6D|nr:PKD domain-containing protein [uncultured Nocardioides sp.]MAO80934.1 hypothetical protein [Nocardioides sp.]